MSIADKYRPQFTYEDYSQWEGRWELIDGMPYAMSPSPVRKHQRVSGNLFSAFMDHLNTQCKHCSIYLPIDWKIDDRTIVQPDLFIVCRQFESDFLEFPPSLVIEILSPSTVFKDRHEKFELYEEQQVKYYLIVDSKFKKIEIYELIENKYQLVSVNPTLFEFILENDCRVTVNLEGAFT